MKVRIIAIAIGLSLALSAARANPLLEITEVTATSGDFLIAQLGHHPFGTIIGGGEEFLFTLPAGYTFIVGGELLELREPEGFPPGGGFHNVNVIRISDSTTLQWSSEALGFGDRGPITIMNLIRGPNGQLIDVKFTDAPEPASTLSLLGIGLAGLAWFARIRRTPM